jgi:hypothetical protein
MRVPTALATSLSDATDMLPLCGLASRHVPTEEERRKCVWRKRCDPTVSFLSINSHTRRDAREAPAERLQRKENNVHVPYPTSP